MLKYDQVEKLEIAQKWLEEIIGSKEFQELDINPDLTLGDSLQGIEETLNHYYPEGYLPPQFTDEPVSEQDQLPTNKPAIQFVFIKRTRFWRSILIDALSQLAIISLLTAAVSAGIWIFFWGVSDIDKATGNKLKPDFAATSLEFRGLSIAALGLFLTAGVSASIIASGEKN